MPAITLGLFQMTLIMRLVRAEMLEVLRADYIRFARARGLTDRSVNFGHALKNTLIPVITVCGPAVSARCRLSRSSPRPVFRSGPGMGLLLRPGRARTSTSSIMAAYLLFRRRVFRG